MEEVKFLVMEQIDRLEELLLDSARIPFSGNRLVNEQESIVILDELRKNLPHEIVHSKKMISEGNKFLLNAKSQAEEIIRKGKYQRDKMISAIGIQQEADRQINELRIQSKQQYEKIIAGANNQSQRLQQEMNSKIANLEKEYAFKRKKMEEEAIMRKDQLSKEAQLMKQRLENNHHKNLNKALKDLENINNEASRLQIESNKKADLIIREAISFREKTLLECDSRIKKAKKDSSNIEKEANKYASQTLISLDRKIRQMSRVISGGIEVLENERTNNSQKTSNKIH